MIRDPSDGSVKEKPEVGIPATEIAGHKPVIETGTSGLPKHKREELNRLNESREWLKQWTNRKVENDER